MVRAWRTYDFRAVFHLACKVGLTPEMIAVTTGLPLDLVLNVMKGNATLSRDPAASEPVAAGLGMPGDIRGIVGLPLPPQSRVPVPLTKPKDAPARRPESAPTATLRLRESVGDRIAKLRRQRGLTQEQLAEQAGISLTMISKLEQQARTPSLAMLDSVAQALDVPASYFLQPGPHKGQPGRRNQRPPDHLPAEILSKPDFIAACETRDLGTVFQIAASHGFMRSHLARRCEMTVGQVSAYILGARKAQDVDIFCRVSDGLHIPGAMLGIGQREWETSNPPHASRQSEAHPADSDEESGLPADTRTCSRCDRPLSRYNNTDYCGPCATTDDRLPAERIAPEPGADIGTRLRAARLRRGMTLETLGRLCGVSAAYISMVENGKRRLDRYSMVISLANALRIPASEIAAGLVEAQSDIGEIAAGMSDDNRERESGPGGAGVTIRKIPNQDDEDRLIFAARHPRNYDPGVIDSLAVVLSGQRRIEDAIGSTPLVQPVQAQFNVVRELVTEARGDMRDRVLDIGSQWAQFAGWLHANTGRYEEASRFYAMALEWATEAERPDMVATALNMQGHVAWLCAKSGPVIGLSRAAQRDIRTSPGVRALAVQQEARGMALSGEANISDIDRRFDQAANLIEQAAENTENEPPWIYFFSSGYLILQRGLAYGLLGEYVKANYLVIAGLSAIPIGMRQTEYVASHYLLQLAINHARSGDLRAACSVAKEIGIIARHTNSEKLREILASFSTNLVQRWPENPDVCDLGNSLNWLAALNAPG